MRRQRTRYISKAGYKTVIELIAEIKVSSNNFLIAFLLCLSVSVFGQTPSSNLFGMNDFEIAHVGFNTRASDFGPSFVGNEIWFSAFPTKQLRKAFEGKFDGIYYKIFKTPIDERGYTLYEPRTEVFDFSTPFHEGPVSYCAKTGELFVTLSNFINVDVESEGLIVEKQKVRLRLVSYKYNDGVWILNEEMPFNDNVYSVGQPSVSPSGDTLFFVSDIPTIKKGGKDIFMVIRTNGSWGDPVPLGNSINTSGNEMFPFYHPSGMLLFASDGCSDNKGGLDLYCSDLLPDGFAPAIPLTQFNSKYDDFGLIIHTSGESGYFVSNRPGQNGNDDIYLVKIKKTYMQIAGTIIDDFSGNPVKRAEVVLYNCDGKKIDSGIVGDNGQFLFKVLRGGCYVVSAAAVGYPEKRKAFGKDRDIRIELKHDRSLELVFLDYETRKPINNVRLNLDNSIAVQLVDDGIFYKKLTIERDIPVYVTAGGYLNQKTVVNTTANYFTEQTILMMKLELNKSYNIEDVNFGKDDWSISPVTQTALDKFIILLKENPAIKVELGNYTDSRGDDQYNLALSRRRSESLVGYIMKNGIPKERIVAKGYGESNLHNRCENGVECSEEEHAQNNRTEFKIVGFVK